jgi:hypothetical protein
MNRRQYGVLAAVAGSVAVIAFLFFPSLSSGAGENERVIVAGLAVMVAAVAFLRAIQSS